MEIINFSLGFSISSFISGSSTTILITLFIFEASSNQLLIPQKHIFAKIGFMYLHPK